MAALLPNPVPQFCDADGNPYAGGTIETYVPGTSTPKATWLDPLQAALNTNPIVLDAAGRCVMYGDGAYRLILRDVAGNEIWDQPSDTIVSAAMQPVISAPTIADAVHLLGLDDTVTAEALASAISTEQAARIAADNAEIAARTAAIANLQSQIDAINAAIGALPGPTAVPLIQWAHHNSDADGHQRVTFPVAYATPPSIAIGRGGPGYDIATHTVVTDATGFDIWWAFPEVSGPVPEGATSYYYIATGPRP
jgi:hypothetical protein